MMKSVLISSEQAKKIYSDRLLFQSEKKQSGKEGWHSDISFEPVPSDYALLRLTQLPKTGGGKSLLFHSYLSYSYKHNRYAMGIRLRSLRPPLSSLSEVPRNSHGDLRATQIQRGCCEEWLQNLFRASGCPRKCWRRYVFKSCSSVVPVLCPLREPAPPESVSILLLPIVN